MATLDVRYPTLVDHVKRLDTDGKIAAVGELLSQTNEMLDDMVWQEGNLATGHRITIRTGLPSVYWRKFNKGVPPSKSQTAQVDEACGMLEGFSRVDTDLADLNGNTSAFRADEDSTFIEAMNQQMQNTVVYGNGANVPESFSGLATRFGTIAGAGNAQNIIDAGGTGTDNTSVYLVGWGKQAVFGVYPKGSMAGLTMDDLGKQIVYDDVNNPFTAYNTKYQWKCGLVVKDWRYVVRVANIDVSDLVGITGTQAPSAVTHILKLLSRAVDRIPSFGNARFAFYANRTVHSHLHIHAAEKASSVLAVEPALTQLAGAPSRINVKFLGIPVRKIDALLLNEARVV